MGQKISGTIRLNPVVEYPSQIDIKDACGSQIVDVLHLGLPIHIEYISIIEINPPGYNIDVHQKVLTGIFTRARQIYHQLLTVQQRSACLATCAPCSAHPLAALQNCQSVDSSHDTA